jgi:hypothetical protein
MDIKNTYYFVIATLAIYLFIYYTLISIKYDLNLYFSALILLVLLYIGIFTCPLIREGECFKSFFKKKRF